VLDATTLAPRAPIASLPRAHANTVVLDTGVVLVSGGTGTDGEPLSTIEFYTP
jgi:hypothetical protein